MAGSAAQEKCTFSSGGVGRISRRAGRVGPRPFGYCSEVSTGRPRIFAPSTSARPYFTTGARFAHGGGEALLHVDEDDTGALAVEAVAGGHDAPLPRPARGATARLAVRPHTA